MESQQLLTQCEILQDEFFSGPKCADEPADEVPEQRNHGKNLSWTASVDCVPSHSFHESPKFWRTTGSAGGESSGWRVFSTRGIHCSTLADTLRP